MNKKALTLYSLTLLLLMGALAAGGYFYYKYQKLAKSPAVQSQKDFDNTLANVGKLMQLPEDEQPSVATITDVEKLREQEPFFQKAENGDRLIAYSKALKAILYRPSTHKIIDVVPLVINQNGGETTQNQEGQAQGPEISEKKSVVIYNGTANTGLGQQAREALEASFADELTISSILNAAVNTYEDTKVVDLSQDGSDGELALKLADTFGGSVESLPAGEQAPQADLLVIVGSSWAGTQAPATQ